MRITLTFIEIQKAYMSQKYSLVWCFLVLFFTTSCELHSTPDIASNPSVSIPRFRIGDSKQWAEKNYDDQLWSTERGNTENKIFWVRFHIELGQSAAEHLGLAIHSFGAFETYWDGNLIGKNGSVGDNFNSEIPGTADSQFLIPDALAKTGSHVVALRMSQSYLFGNNRKIHVRIAEYTSLIRSPLILTAFMYILAGAFLIAAIYYLFLYINNRKAYAIFIFSTTCFLFFVLLILEYLKFYVAIPYTHFYVRLESIGILTFAVALLVPWYFTIQFSFPWKKIFLITLGVCLIGTYIVCYKRYDLSAQLFSIFMWIASLVIAIYAVKQSIAGGIIVLMSLLIIILINVFFYYDISLFISFGVIVLCMLYILAIRTREQERSYESSLLLSSRLKNELLRKHIQPHFLMNTLTSLIDWVEESPKEGVAFIEALAHEFEILSQIADYSVIPITQEIQLCRSHLAVMKYRKEINYEWEEHGIDTTATIPPAILHTALENGITHSLPLEDGSLRFRLQFEATHQWKKYELIVFARNRPVLSYAKTGTGLQYIRARLTESYSSLWDLHSEAIPEGWKTTITIYLNQRAIR